MMEVGSVGRSWVAEPEMGRRWMTVERKGRAERKDTPVVVDSVQGQATHCSGEAQCTTSGYRTVGEYTWD
jgi:hypothetical protein